MPNLILGMIFIHRLKKFFCFSVLFSKVILQVGGPLSVVRGPWMFPETPSGRHGGPSHFTVAPGHYLPVSLSFSQSVPRRFSEAAPRDAATGWMARELPSRKPCMKEIYRKHRPMQLFHILLPWKKRTISYFMVQPPY